MLCLAPQLVLSFVLRDAYNVPNSLSAGGALQPPPQSLEMGNALLYRGMDIAMVFPIPLDCCVSFLAREAPRPERRLLSSAVPLS